MHYRPQMLQLHSKCDSTFQYIVGVLQYLAAHGKPRYEAADELTADPKTSFRNQLTKVACPPP